MLESSMKNDTAKVTWDLMDSCRGRLNEMSVSALASYLLVDAVEKGTIELDPDNKVVERAKHIFKENEEFIKEHGIEAIVNEHTLSNRDRIEIIMKMEEVLSEKHYGAPNRTPAWVAKIVCGLLNPTEEDTVYDLGSGDGAFLLEVDNYVREHYSAHPKLVGSEIVEKYVFASEIVLTLQQADFSIYAEDVLWNKSSDQFNKAYVFAPLGMRYNGAFTDCFNDEYGDLFNTQSRSEWLFVFKALQSVRNNGMLVALVPDGALFRSSDMKIRKYLLDNDLLQGIVSLPAGIITGTGTKISLVVLGSSDGTFRIVDATSMGKESGERNPSIDPEVVLNAYFDPDCTVFSYEEAGKRDYNLTASAYSDIGVFDDIDCPAKISDVADVIVGSQYTISHFKKNFSNVKTDYQILTSSNIENGLIDYDHLQYIEENKKLEKFELREGDIVVTTKSTIVKTAVANELPQRHIIVTGGMLIIRPDESKINPTYLKMFLDSETGKSVMRSTQKGAVITSISTPAFKKITVACPDLEKQEALADKYNTLLGMYAGMKQQMENLSLQINSLYDDSLKEEL